MLPQSDGSSEFGEDRWEPMPSVGFHAEFVVAATEVLNEGVPGTDLSVLSGVPATFTYVSSANQRSPGRCRQGRAASISSGVNRCTHRWSRGPPRCHAQPAVRSRHGRTRVRQIPADCHCDHVWREAETGESEPCRRHLGRATTNQPSLPKLVLRRCNCATGRARRSGPLPSQRQRQQHHRCRLLIDGGLIRAL